MRVMMISENDIASTESLGVTKKIMGQFHAFQNLECDVYSLCLKDGQGALLHGEETKILFPRQVKNYIAYVKLFSMAADLCKKYAIEMCYIRYPLADWVFMGMVKKLHKLCKVVVEIPTYPYDQQNKNNRNLVARANMFQDRHFRNHMQKHIDLISTFSVDKSIWGIPCVNISNGIDISQIRYLGDQLKYEDDIHLIGVARLQRDHGYDRVIEGLKEYYNSTPKHQRNIYFHIVGKGDAEAELKNLVEQYHLDEYVFFHGIKTGADLEQVYLQCQIAIGSLASYRSGIKLSSELKKREYCAVGIPFIGVRPDTSIPSGAPYYRIVEDSGTPINMNDVIDFFQYIKDNPQIHKVMRNHAEKEMTWDYQIKKVLSLVF